jgi:biotin transport system ATP-binding protein
VEPVICNATRMIIMENGRIQQDRPPSELVKELETYGIKEPCASKLGRKPLPWLN